MFALKFSYIIIYKQYGHKDAKEPGEKGRSNIPWSLDEIAK